MADEPDAPLPSFPGFETLEKLGEGGMCEVYRVVGDDGERAVKVLTDTNKGSAERFASEARMLQRLDHPNVLKVYALHDDVRPPWIEMQLLAGRDLEKTRRKNGPTAPEQVARWFADLASGLARVHAEGVRHRDIKPANIMLGHDGVPRLIDFGIARQTNTAHVTRQGFVVGTASYLPPEIFFDDDSRAIQDSEVADVYALGQSLCEVLTGESVHPRTKGGDAAALVRVMKDKVERPYLDPRDWLPSCPAGLAEIVVHATRQEPEERLATAVELERRLREWLSHRMAAEAAPVTLLGKGQLPAPPTPAPAERRDPPPSAARPPTPPPAPVAPEAPTATPAPVARVATGAAGAAGFMGVGGVALGSLALAIGLVAALWAYAPTAGADGGAVQQVVAGKAQALGECGLGSDEVVLRLVHQGTSLTVDRIAGRLEGASLTCVRSTLAAGVWPPGDWVAEVPLRRR